MYLPDFSMTFPYFVSSPACGFRNVSGVTSAAVPAIRGVTWRSRNVYKKAMVEMVDMVELWYMAMDQYL